MIEQVLETHPQIRNPSPERICVADAWSNLRPSGDVHRCQIPFVGPVPLGFKARLAACCGLTRATGKFGELLTDEALPVLWSCCHLRRTV